MDKPKDLKQELSDLSVAFAKISEDFKAISATKNPKDSKETEVDPKAEINFLHDRMSNMHNNLHASIENVHQRVDKIANLHYEHASSAKHLPPLTPTQLNKLIKHAGAEGDVQILPKQIFSKDNNTIFASYVKPVKV